jgi:hypothetical protein
MTVEWKVKSWKGNLVILVYVNIQGFKKYSKYEDSSIIIFGDEKKSPFPKNLNEK